MGASDLPRAAVWVGTAEWGGTGKGAGHQLSTFLHRTFLLFVFILIFPFSLSPL